MRKAGPMFWYVLYFFIAKHLPCSYARLGGRAARWLRFACCSRFIAGCGSNVNIERGATFGRRVWIGNDSHFGIDCRIDGEFHMGDACMMGPEVMIFTGNHGFERTDIAMIYQPSSQEKPVWLGDDVWIGARAILLPGVRVGSHAIVGAGAVVTRSVPEWAIVGGNPARVIRYRHPVPSEAEARVAGKPPATMPGSGLAAGLSEIQQSVERFALQGDARGSCNLHSHTQAVQTATEPAGRVMGADLLQA